MSLGVDSCRGEERAHEVKRSERREGPEREREREKRKREREREKRERERERERKRERERERERERRREREREEGERETERERERERERDGERGLSSLCFDHGCCEFFSYKAKSTLYGENLTVVQTEITCPLIMYYRIC